jgi:hypothetical protein
MTVRAIIIIVRWRGQEFDFLKIGKVGQQGEDECEAFLKDVGRIMPVISFGLLLCTDGWVECFAFLSSKPYVWRLDYAQRDGFETYYIAWRHDLASSDLIVSRLSSFRITS